MSNRFKRDALAKAVVIVDDKRQNIGSQIENTLNAYDWESAYRLMVAFTAVHEVALEIEALRNAS